MKWRRKSPRRSCVVLFGGPGFADSAQASVSASWPRDDHDDEREGQRGRARQRCLPIFAPMPAEPRVLEQGRGGAGAWTSAGERRARSGTRGVPVWRDGVPRRATCRPQPLAGAMVIVAKYMRTKGAITMTILGHRHEPCGRSGPSGALNHGPLLLSDRHLDGGVGQRPSAAAPIRLATDPIDMNASLKTNAPGVRRRDAAH